MAFQTTQITETILVGQVRRIAEEYDQCQVSTAMVALALLECAEELMSFVLQVYGLNTDTLRRAAAEQLAASPPQEGDLNYGPDVLETLHKAQQYAESTAGGIVAPEHILWGVATSDNAMGRMLRRHGMNEASLAKTIRRYRHEPEEEQQAEQQESVSDIPTIAKYSKDLLKAAREGEIEAAIGRDSEIRQILRALCRKNKNNPALVGPPGTGKTAIIEGLAHRIVRGDVPETLRHIRLYSLEFSSLTAECQKVGELEKILRKLIDEATSHHDIVLFIDEIHLLVGSKGSNMDAANILKPEMARGRLRLIGATTLDEYRKYIEADKAFERRFQKIIIDEPDEEAAIAILRGIKKRYEEHFRIKIADSAILAAVRLSIRYITDRYLPDKALDLLDEAAATMQLERESVPVELDRATRALRQKEIELESIRSDYRQGCIPEARQQEIAHLQMDVANLQEQENLIRSRWLNECRSLEELQSLESARERLEGDIIRAEEQRDYRKSVSLRQQAEALDEDIRQRQEAQRAQSGKALLKRALDEEEIHDVVSLKTGIPVSKMTENEREKLRGLESHLSGRVMGQDEAVRAVSKVIRRNRRGLSDAGRPIGSFLFLGTTGVGKTELARALADFMFNSPDMMVRIDMSEYQQEHSVSRLFGAPPGYVGYEQGGQLTEAVRRKPYSVVLFDEIEKAHPKVFQTLLQVLDDGRMTDGQGRVVNFRNTVIIMTSNMGYEIITRHMSGGLLPPEAIETVKAQVMQCLREKVAPEFLNRINEIVMFRMLNKENIRQIVGMQLQSLCKKLAMNNMHIRYDDAAVNFLTEAAYEPEYGARPVARALNLHVTDTIIDKLDNQELAEDKTIFVSASPEGLLLHNEAS